MESDPAEMPKKHTIVSGMNTTLPSDAKPFYVSTESDSEEREFTDSDSTFQSQSTEKNSSDTEQFITDFSEESGFRTCGYSASAIMERFLRNALNDGSTGRSPEEAEH